MKTATNTRLLMAAALTYLMCLQIHAQTLANTNIQTKIYPITDIRDGWGSEDAQYYGSQRILGSTIPEILPAAKDSAGNWGKYADGLQLSLRFRRHEYLQKETVTAIIILRNLDLVSRKTGISDERDFQYTLYCGTNKFVWKKNPLDQVYDDGIPINLEASAEVLQTVFLNRLFNLDQPGKYSLQVQIPVPTSDGKGETNVISGTATFEIVKKPSP